MWLWFGGKDGWQLTSFNPKDEPVHVSEPRGVWINEEYVKSLEYLIEQAKKEEAERVCENCKHLEIPLRQYSHPHCYVCPEIAEPSMHFCSCHEKKEKEE